MSSPNAPTRLALSDDPLGTAHTAPWIGPLVALGARVSRYADQLDGRQLVAVISVPRRDFAAPLIGCGWVMTSRTTEQTDPLDVLRGLEHGTPVRVVTSQEVISDHFTRLNEVTKPARVQLHGSHWQVSAIKALGVLANVQNPARMPRPSPGALGKLARVEHTWNARLASPAADLAIVGTLTWLRDEMEALVSRENEGSVPAKATGSETSIQDAPTTGEISSLGNVLLPESPKAATWFTRLYATARFADQLPLPDDVRAVVLDGAGAIKYLAQIEAPVVVCVLDRSVADETAAEMVVQLRNSRGEPISLREDLGWSPPVGVEALAFTVAL